MVGCLRSLGSDERRSAHDDLVARWTPLGVRPAGWMSHLTVFVDGFCPTCTASAGVLRRLDRGNRLSIRSFREDASFADWGITESALLARMHVVDVRRHRVWSGFAAVQALSRALPALWPIVPLLGTARLLGLGNRVYDYLALRRRLVPDPRVCVLASDR